MHVVTTFLVTTLSIVITVSAVLGLIAMAIAPLILPKETGQRDTNHETE